MSIKKKYKFAVIATDIVIFTVAEDSLKVLLIKMKKHPFEGYWAAPGGLVKPRESVDSSAERNLKEKTGLSGVYLEQLYTFGRVARDPFGRVVSVAYYALIPSGGIKLKTTKEYEDVKWFEVRGLPKLAYDHREIIAMAIARLQERLGSTNVAYSLLPRQFTLTGLQKVYEIILGRKLDKRNFRKKFLSTSLIRRIGHKTSGGAHRPAELYEFTSHTLKTADML